MRVETDVRRCVAAGMCTLMAPNVFDQDEETGMVRVLSERPAGEEWEAVEEAARSCPAQVIEVLTAEPHGV